MTVYKRILLATDFSDINLVAARRAVLLAERDGSELILLHVIEHFPWDGGPLSSVFQNRNEASDALVGQARSRMSALTRDLGYEKIREELSVTPKSARHEILSFAKAHDVDLIVVAPHGQGIIGTLGSTATGILNNAVCDVLAVREAVKLT